jgi:putative membrane protein
MNPELQSFLIALLLSGVGILVVARIVPGFHLRGGLGSAMLVGLVYGLLKALFQTALIILSAPLVIATLGLFILIINAFLLWLTDKLMSRLTITSIGSLLLGALLLSLIDFAFHVVLRHGALF